MRAISAGQLLRFDAEAAITSVRCITAVTDSGRSHRSRFENHIERSGVSDLSRKPDYAEMLRFGLSERSSPVIGQT